MEFTLTGPAVYLVAIVFVIVLILLWLRNMKGDD